jgi:small subunit ribosomal protein S5
MLSKINTNNFNNEYIKDISNIYFKEKIIQIKRLTKVTSGGKKLTFRAIVVLGDFNGKIGLGIGRSEDVINSINKAIINAKKKLILIPITNNFSIPFSIKIKYNATNILVKPANLGVGLITNNSLKPVFELSGIKNIITKQFKSNNILNNLKLIFLIFIKLNEKVKIYKFKNINKCKNNIKNYILY